MSEIERKRLDPIHRGGPTITEGNLREYANHLLRNEWSGPSAYHADGNIRDFDERIYSLSNVRRVLNGLKRGMTDEDSLARIDSTIRDIERHQRELLERYRYLTEVAPFRSEPRLNFQDYGPAIDAKKHDDFSRGRSYFDVAFGAKSMSPFPQDRYQRYRGMSRVTLPAGAPGGLMLSGGLLGGLGRGLGALLGDVWASSSANGKAISKSGSEHVRQRRY